MNPVLLIHGGAGKARTPEVQRDFSERLHTIATTVWPALDSGGSALDAVTEACRLLENDPAFNAGLGSKLQLDGNARLSASIMDGQKERFGGVVNIEGLRNPILLARELMDERDRVLVGEGALVRARQLGLEEADVRTEEAIQRWKDGIEGQTGTVGATAVDTHGHTAAATSTGGRGLEQVGRMSDSCTAAGNFATPIIAISCTGVGEDIVDGGLAVRLATMVEGALPLERAAARLRLRMEDRGWQAGLIAVNARGGWATTQTTEALYWLKMGPDGPQSFLDY